MSDIILLFVMVALFLDNIYFFKEVVSMSMYGICKYVLVLARHIVFATMSKRITKVLCNPL